MSPQLKYDFKWALGIFVSLTTLIIITVTSTAKIMAKFNLNDVDHTVIKQDLAAEIYRATGVDAARDIAVKEITSKLDDVASKQVQVMTKQDRILSDIQDISDKLP